MKRLQTLFFFHGKISKKSKIVYRVRNNRQQCYTLNHSTPNSAKQLRQQSIFGQTITIINRELANPKQKKHWQNIATLSSIKGYTARKAAYAHYSQLLTTQQLIALQTQHTHAIRSTPAVQQAKQTKQNAHPIQYKNTLNNAQLKSLALISYLMLYHYKTGYYIPQLETTTKQQQVP